MIEIQKNMNTNDSNILVTGGAGFIGSHAVLALMQQGYRVMVLDNFSNAQPTAIDNIKIITGHAPLLYKGDIRDKLLLEDIFSQQPIHAVMHFAGLKAVGESMREPLSYYANNVAGSLNLLQAMQQHDVKKFIFSSSATVYGVPQSLPLTEASPLAPINPYGESKLMVENILADLCRSDKQWRVASLRYFNPCGADSTGLIGEDPLGTPNNLMPIILKVAGGEMEKLQIFGDDYDTPDGTGIRDYIHVVDLVAAHIKALAYLDNHPGFNVFNLGRGHGYSVLEMLKTFEEATGRNKPLPVTITNRRPGDSPAVWADATRANQVLGWHAEKDLTQMCVDSWRFYQQSKKT